MKSAVSFLFILLAIGLSSATHATTYYYLIGLRHDFRVEGVPSRTDAKRREIEETYADALEAAQNRMDASLQAVFTAEESDGGQPHLSERDDAQRMFERDAEEAAERRDEQLGSIYILDDEVRVEFPELRLVQDGPYELVGLDCNADGEIIRIQFFPYYQGFTGYNAFGFYGVYYYQWISYTNFKAETFPAARKEWLDAGSPFFGPFHRRHRPEVNIEVMVRPEMVIDHKKWGEDGLPPRLVQKDRSKLAAQVEKYRSYLKSSGESSQDFQPRSAFSPTRPRTRTPSRGSEPPKTPPTWPTGEAGSGSGSHVGKSEPAKPAPPQKAPPKGVPKGATKKKKPNNGGG
jgi:hypothetical protein